MIKVLVENEPVILKSIDLESEASLKKALERDVKDKKFVRISVTDRCISIKGYTYNIQTGHSWSFFVGENSKPIEIHSVENCFCSSLQVAQAVEGESESDKSLVLLFKMNPSTRRLCTLEKRCHDVLLLELITENLLLIKLQSNGEDKSYWTIIDTEGITHALPLELEKLLNGDSLHDWTNITIKRDDITEEEGEDLMKGQRDTRDIMLLFTSLNVNLACTIVTMDYKASRVKRIDEFAHNQIVKKIRQIGDTAREPFPVDPDSKKNQPGLDSSRFVYCFCSTGRAYLISFNPEKDST